MGNDESRKTPWPRHQASKMAAPYSEPQVGVEGAGEHQGADFILYLFAVENLLPSCRWGCCTGRRVSHTFILCPAKLESLPLRGSGCGES